MSAGPCIFTLEDAKKYTVHGGFNFSTKALHYLCYFLLYGSTHGKGRYHYFYSYCLQLSPLSSNSDDSVAINKILTLPGHWMISGNIA